jgi:hypothetical protein
MSGNFSILVFLEGKINLGLIETSDAYIWNALPNPGI